MQIDLIKKNDKPKNHNNYIMLYYIIYIVIEHLLCIAMLDFGFHSNNVKLKSLLKSTTHLYSLSLWKSLL